MPRISQDIIDMVLDRIDIVEIISDRLQLKKNGRNFKTCCPFHNEKTPSFVVSPDKQIYHCFGCHAGGNAINFLMKYENLEFPEALRILAGGAGVEIPSFQQKDSAADSRAAEIYEINKRAALFYQKVLVSKTGHKALEYLKNRGLSRATITEFRIGYAPEGWEYFKKHCMGAKIRPELLRKAGLTVLGEKGRGDYDRFRNRIIFPVYNERGSVVAFGARVMDKSLPKYINSPETPVYRKSNVLYGLNFSKRGIREVGYALIVEGYMDVIIPFQEGVKNAVATSGTSMTSQQVLMLKKYTDTCVMVYDSDQAGQAASLRGLDLLIENDMKVRIVTLPEGEDPASFIQKEGKEAFLDMISSAKDLLDYKLDLLLARPGPRDAGSVADEMLPTISKIGNAVTQSDYLRKLAERLGVHEAALRHEMGKVKPDFSSRYEREPNIDKVIRNYRNSEVHILGLCILDESRFRIVENEIGSEGFHDDDINRAMRAIKEMFDKGTGPINPGKLLSRVDKDEAARAVVVQALAKADITNDPERVLRDCICRVKKENRSDRLRDLTAMLREAQNKGSDDEMRKIIDRINQIHKEKVA